MNLLRKQQQRKLSEDMNVMKSHKLASSVLTIDLKSLLAALIASIADVLANSDSTAVVFALNGA